jgi:hypothetical protein
LMILVLGNCKRWVKRPPHLDYWLLTRVSSSLDEV